MKNKLLLAVVRQLKKAPVRRSAPRRILVVATTALGDTLWATPALESLRKSFPDARIAVLTSPIGEEVLRHNPWVDQLYIVREPMLPRIWGLRKELLREEFQDIVIFHASQRLTLPLAATLGAHRIVGTAGINKGLDALLTEAVIPSLEEHEIERRLKLIERIGASKHSDNLSLFLLPEERLASKAKDRPLVALHPGSKDGFKRWPAEHFATVGSSLAKKGAKIIVTGSRQELPLMRETAQKIPGAELGDPTWTMRQFAAHLEQMDLLISNDTGPVHLAIALKRPVLALYSPTDPLRCGPYKATHAVSVSRPPSCDACLKRKCRRPFCLLQIGPQEVLEKAEQLLGRDIN